jgi:5'-3' exonuclease
MAGCEYLPNIERVGLKLALKHFEKYGSFDKVIEFLQSQKTFKDRIPPNYIADAKKVAELFKNQTVYDVKTRKLT